MFKKSKSKASSKHFLHENMIVDFLVLFQNYINLSVENSNGVFYNY